MLSYMVKFRLNDNRFLLLNSMIKNLPSRQAYVILSYLIISIALTFPIWSHDGIPMRFDWSWPVFDMREFFQSIFGQAGAQNGFLGTFSHNASFLLGLPSLLHIPPERCLKLFLIATHTAAAYGFFRFISLRIKSKALAVLGGLVYAFTPYVFIRTIVGFIFSLVAYAALPYFLKIYLDRKPKTIRSYLWLGFLLSLISSQAQAGILTILFIFIYALLNARQWRDQAKLLVATLVSFTLFNLPWLIIVLVYRQSGIANGHEATTLSFIASLPHSLRMMLMTSDHHITYGYFAPLARNPLMVTAYITFYAIGLFALLSKKNRQFALTGLITLAVTLPFLTGPVGYFGSIFTWVYNHFPLLAVFRETYHFQFIIAPVSVILFILGSDNLFGWLDRGLRLKALATTAKIIIILSALMLLRPYFTFNYAGYLSLQSVPEPYFALRQYLKDKSSTCQKIFYPPGLGFNNFKNDPLANKGASNSDIIARALNIPHLDGGATVLNLPNKDTYYRNELVSQFYEKDDNGEFSRLLAEGKIDCVVVRTDIVTQFSAASNLGKEQDPVIKNKWLNTDYLGLTRSKKNLSELVGFDNSIYIFKPVVSSQSPPINSGSGIEQFPVAASQESPIYPPLSSWASNYFYYKDGWSRGRYDFWRKHLFTELRQDFIYTDKPDAIISGKISGRGSHELWARYLTGGTAGEVELRIKNYELRIRKATGEEKFIWSNIGNVKLDGETNIEIINISGENAISDLALVESAN